MGAVAGVELEKLLGVCPWQVGFRRDGIFTLGDMVSFDQDAAEDAKENCIHQLLLWDEIISPDVKLLKGWLTLAA